MVHNFSFVNILYCISIWQYRLCHFSKNVSLSWITKRIYIIYWEYKFINVCSSKPSPCKSNFPFWESCMVSELTCWRFSVVGQTWRIMFLLRNLILLPSWRTTFWMRLCSTGVYDPYSFGKDWTPVWRLKENIWVILCNINKIWISLYKFWIL